ncbi:MFS transporter [Bordetella holmesii]|uniref:Transporter, major facilitator domain protein n=2 Tax=Bordetella holmesii TaxID=35814 RepID=A0A158M573_9BORD|nr:MFS transporter [Bordetella holmesii]EWM41216.1 major Facilitator Superfamily protein [Bordetella holmesii 35009]EWM42633.1 major Facilitator Superfamily protein [Bordetella holmesii 41130]AMD47087.1 permease [Bordetella holmesii H558]AMD50470.1 hypothetical protein F783_000825 [Bordetella holmesii F627]AOB35988.1 permease [Bordetella holmesii]
MSNRSRTVWLVVGLLLVAANLRAPVTAVAPVLSILQEQFRLSAAQAGLLTTLPLLAFGLVSPFAGAIARAHGLERTVLVALLAIAAGVLLRSAGAISALYAGTLLAGMGIALGNVLLPSIIKRDFPGRVALVTSACALTMGGAAAIASASAVPLTGVGGWPLALALLGLSFWPAWAPLWAFCLGAGSGAGLILALMFMGLRAATPRTAAALSGMAQCLGYLLVASGPLLAGKAYAWSHSWTQPLGIGVVLCVAMAGFGALAGRARLLGDGVLPSAQKR